MFLFPEDKIRNSSVYRIGTFCSTRKKESYRASLLLHHSWPGFRNILGGPTAAVEARRGWFVTNTEQRTAVTTRGARDQPPPPDTKKELITIGEWTGRQRRCRARANITVRGDLPLTSSKRLQWQQEAGETSHHRPALESDNMAATPGTGEYWQQDAKTDATDRYRATPTTIRKGRLAATTRHNGT